MSSQKLIRGILLLLWCAVIFWFSAQGGAESQDLSDGLLRFFPFSLFPWAGVLIRKFAHSAEFFVLAFFAFLFFDTFKKGDLPAFVFCFLYACSDELHQLFVGGRAARFTDVLIDMTGVLLFWLLRRLFLYFRKQRHAEEKAS
ncbi:MAG: VanZ family protein [Erysipelotrichaceae bacterium]|nr:VanZ family protein [Erysipelotrichaceae bacterium]